MAAAIDIDKLQLGTFVSILGRDFTISMNRGAGVVVLIDDQGGCAVLARTIRHGVLLTRTRGRSGIVSKAMLGFSGKLISQMSNSLDYYFTWFLHFAQHSCIELKQRDAPRRV
jgi:hypothetical protein